MISPLDEKAEHQRIWLEPAGAPDRCWCSDNQWDEEGVEYVLASQAQTALAAMRIAIATPEAVHANMLRGGIPKLSIRQALHLHGAEALEKWDRAETAEAQVQRLTEALNEIRELNMSGADENGHRWANSDMIEQTIVAARATLNSRENKD